MKKRTKLFAPPSYWRATEEEKKKICNGCGPKCIEWLVPDSPLGFDFKEPCNIHDWTWHFEQPFSDDTMKKWNRVFRNNLIRRVVDAVGQAPKLYKTGWFRWFKNIPYRKWDATRRLGMELANTYYEAVEKFGAPAYWKDKNPPETLG